jgi:hypothetical protein
MQLSTTRYLGRESTGEQFLPVLARFGGVYTPEKWGTEEATLRDFDFDPQSAAEVLDKWTLPAKAKRLFFHRKRSVEIQMSFSIDRFPRAKFNTFSASIRDQYFKNPGKIDEYLDFAIDHGPYKAEMLETDDVVNSIKAYLNQNSFAGPNFPNQPCAVPEFDFSDVRCGTEPPPVVQSPREKVALMRSELESKGYKLVSESPKRLILRGKDGSAVLLNPETGELSVDTTGALFLPSEP